MGVVSFSLWLCCPSPWLRITLALNLFVIPVREDNRGKNGDKKNPAETALQICSAGVASAGFLPLL
jgi:hypothetical protein